LGKRLKSLSYVGSAPVCLIVECAERPRSEGGKAAVL
jgi:hypothetical protein